MYHHHKVPELIAELIGRKLDAPIVNQCETTEVGRICTATYSVFHIDVTGIPHPFAVTRDHCCFIVLHRGSTFKGDTLEEAVSRAVNTWTSLAVAI